MAYITSIDLVNRFGEKEIAALTRGGEAADKQAKIDTAIADAEAQINGCLSARYSVPIAFESSLLKRWAADIARYLLHDNSPSEIVIKRYDDAIKSLKDIRDGKSDLAGATAETDANQSAASDGGLIHVVTPASKLNLDKY